MQFIKLLSVAPAVLLSTLPFTAASPVPAALEARQAYSTTWRDTCSDYKPANNFKAFNLGNCQAQLTFGRSKLQYTYNWVFDSIYPDGSR